jgi:hypothetical protein
MRSEAFKQMRAKWDIIKYKGIKVYFTQKVRSLRH